MLYEVITMGGSGAAEIIFRGDPEIEKKTQEYIDEFSTPYKAAERGFIDQVIEPKETRPRLIAALRMLENKEVNRPKRKHGNIPL